MSKKSTVISTKSVTSKKSKATKSETGKFSAGKASVKQVSKISDKKMAKSSDKNSSKVNSSNQKAAKLKKKIVPTKSTKSSSAKNGKGTNKLAAKVTDSKAKVASGKLASPKKQQAVASEKKSMGKKPAEKKLVEKKLVGRPAMNKEVSKKADIDKSKKLKDVKASSLKSKQEPEVAPRKRGRPSLASLGLASKADQRDEIKEMSLDEIKDFLNQPKKRGRKPKAFLDAIAKAKEAGVHIEGVTNFGESPLLSPDTPPKRKRGRPRKSEQLGYGGSGPGRYNFAPRANVAAKRYVWSAETGTSLVPDLDAVLSGEVDAIGPAFEFEVEFREKDKIVYPAHGLGVIEAIQSRSVGTGGQKFYMISIVETGMRIMVPVSQAKTVGLRRVVDPSTVDKVYAILKNKDVEIDNQTWNRRYREYSQKIKTGSVLEIASVIRDLTVLKVDKELSFNERRMLDTAQGLLVKELSIAKSSSEDTIREELEQICQL